MKIILQTNTLTVDGHFAGRLGPVLESDLVFSLVSGSDVEDGQLRLALAGFGAALLAGDDLLPVLEPLGSAFELGLAGQLHTTFLLVDLHVLQWHDDLDGLHEKINQLKMIWLAHSIFSMDCRLTRRLRSRRALMLFHDVTLSARRAFILFNDVESDFVQQ